MASVSSHSRKRRKVQPNITPSTSPAAFSPVPCAASVRYFRLLSSGLWGEGTLPGTANSLAGAHFGLQAQDADAVLLAIFNRQHSVSMSRTLLSERYMRCTDSVVRAWGQRCTLHMYSPDDWPIAMGATRERLQAATESRLSRCAESRELCDAISEQVTEVLHAGKEVDTTIVQPLVQKLGSVADMNATACRYPFIHAIERGIATRVTRGAGGGRRLVLAPWNGPWEHFDQHEALCVAARRYFAVYAPAEEQDFRYWMGVKAGASQAAVAQLLQSGELQRVKGIEGDMLVTSGEAEKRLANCAKEVPPREEWPLRLLGRFDPYLLPHRSKEWLVDERYRKRIWSRNADIVPTVIVHGRIRGMWSLKRKTQTVNVSVTLFEVDEKDTVLTDREIKQIKEEAKKIANKFWGATKCTIEIVQESASGKDKEASKIKNKSSQQRTSQERRRRSARSNKLE